MRRPGRGDSQRRGRTGWRARVARRGWFENGDASLPEEAARTASGHLARRQAGRQAGIRRAEPRPIDTLPAVRDSVPRFAVLLNLACSGCVAFVAGCASAPVVTPPITAGSDAAPRDVNIIAFDYSYSPSEVDLVRGETVTLHIINAGLATHEVVIGGSATQDAWEQAEASASPPPPGQSPDVSVPPAEAGLRVVVTSGQRRDVLFRVPASADPLVLGCHVPGHWARGMEVPIRFVDAPVPAA